MIGKGLIEDSLSKLLEQNAVREARVFRSKVRAGHWSIEVRLGGSSSRWIPIRSRREPIRTWASPTAVVKFASAVGLVELQFDLL